MHGESTWNCKGWFLIKWVDRLQTYLGYVSADGRIKTKVYFEGEIRKVENHLGSDSYLKVCKF